MNPHSGWRSWRPSPAMAVSFVALFVALAGSALAVQRNSVGPRELKKNAVRSKHVKNNQIKSKDVKDGQIKSKDIRNGAVTEAKLADSLAGLQGPAGPRGLTGLQGPQGPKGDPGDPATGPAGGDLTGTYPNPTIAANSVGSSEIVDGDLKADDIAIESGVFNLDPGTIAGQSCLRLIVSRPGSGISTQDHVLVTPMFGSPSEGSVTVAGAASSLVDQFGVRFCNLGDTALNPAPGTYMVLIIDRL